jgi:PAS domain S-box-containing protein
MMKRIDIFKYPLAAKFAVAVFCYSLVAAGTTFGFLLLLNFSHSRKELQNTLDQVHKGTENIVATSLWLTDDDMLKVTVNGLVAMPFIEKVTVTKEEGTVFEKGVITSKRTIQHSHELVFAYRGQRVHVGDITITAGLDLPVQKGIDDAITLGLPLLVLALLGGTFSFLFFYLLIGRHLHNIAAYSESINLDSLAVPLVLRLKSQEKNPDELGRIVSALNTMRTSLLHSLAELKEHTAKYEAIVSGSSDAIVCIDDRYRLMYANPSACHVLLRKPVDTPMNMPCRELGLPGHLHASLEAAVAVVIEKGQAQELSFELDTKKGKQSFEMLLTSNEKQDGSVVSVIGVARDITRRKTAEFMLREAFQHLPMLMTISDIQTGAFIEVNDRFVQMTGYAREQAIGTTPVDLGFIAAADRKKLKDVILGQGYIEDMELELTRADGSCMTCMYTGEIIAVDETRALLSMAQDITEHKLSLANRDNLERQLRQAMKMEAIGTLAGGIAHDFNNILSVIIGFTEMAQEDAQLGSSQANGFGKVLIACNRAKDLVQQILNFSRQTAIERYPLQLQPLIKEMLNMLRAALPATIVIHDEIDDRCGPVLADPTQIHQILLNLCTNAGHAMEDSGGILTISLKGVTIADNNPQGLACGNYAEVIISDTGHGIAPDLIDKIFAPYFSTKPPGKGTGMGLAIVYGILKDYGGTVTVDSEMGKGTTFHVYFAITRHADILAVHEDQSIPSGDERILFVDDEEIVAEMGTHMLRRLGYSVTAFTDSTEAFSAFRENPAGFDIVITDQTMPGMTGSKLAQEMLQIRPDLPIILCTGFSSQIDQYSAQAIGIKKLAFKPFNKIHLAKLIRNALKES